MTGKELKSKLKGEGRVYGCAIVSSSPHWPSVVKKSGLDFVFLDTEHICLGRETLAHMCQVYQALGLPPIVRITSPDPYEACVALDGGATGVLAPYVESVDQVKDLVGATKLRPLKGKKLKAILDDPESLDTTLNRYIQDRNADNILLINIESVPALENLDSLLKIPGLDGVIIGPHDLSCSLEVPEDYQHEVFKEAVGTIIKSCRNQGLSVGIHFSEEPEIQTYWAHLGVNIILHSSDIAVFAKALKHDITVIRKAMKDEPSIDDGNEIII